MANLKKETWQNVTRGYVEIQRLDSRGQEKGEMVRPGANAVISAEERRLNQDLAFSPEQDIFRNGIMQPIRVIPDTANDDDDVDEVLDNPNFVSESEINALLKLTPAKLEARLQEITAVATIDRIKEVAEADGNTTTAKAKIIQDRVAEFYPPIVAPSQLDREKDLRGR